jgi:hypothetical protein
MKRKVPDRTDLSLWMLILTLAGCATVVDVPLPDGAMGHGVSCDTPLPDWGACTAMSTKICTGTTFRIINQQEQPEVVNNPGSAATTLQFGGKIINIPATAPSQTVIVHRAMVIACNK